MKRFFLAIIFLISLSAIGLSQSVPPITVREVDGSPRKTNPTELVFPNGVLNITGSRVTIDLSSLVGAPTTATYITQTPNASLSAEQALSALATGLLKNTTSTGVLGIAGASDLPSGIDAAKIGGGAVSNTEFSYLDSVTSPIQAQIDGKQASLGFTAENVANKDTDGTLAANSDTKYASQKATKTYADTKVAGPASATDNAVARFDATTGKLVQDSGITIDDANNLTVPGSVTAGFGSTVAGTLELTQGTAPALGTTSVKLYAPTSVTSYVFVLPSSSATGFLLGTNSSNINTVSFVSSTGTGNVVRNTSPTLTGNLILDKTVTAAGTVGAQTINKITGTVNFAAAAASVIVTNSLADANSIIQCTVATNDATMKSAQCVAGSGSFTIFSNAAATAETRVNFTITN